MVTDSRGRPGSGKGCTRAEKQLTVLLVLCIVVIAVMSVFLVLQRLQVDNLLDVSHPAPLQMALV